MEVINNTLVCKSIPKFWFLEQSSKKPNTIRIEKLNECKRIRTMFFDKTITTIRIVHIYTGEYFERKIMDISLLGEIVGSVIIVISWESIHKNENNSI